MLQKLMLKDASKIELVRSEENITNDNISPRRKKRE
jgi:hypothetical protein